MRKRLYKRYGRHRLLSGIPIRYAYVGSLYLLGTAAGIMALSCCDKAQALGVYSGTVDGQALTINLETTVEYSNIYRINDPSAILAGPGNANGNDGDANFRHGFVDNSFDVAPIFDLTYGNYGVHISGEAYLDTPYLQKNQNNQASTFNPYSTASNRDFTSATRNINGENAELLDAFAYGSAYFGANQNQVVRLKVGRQTLLWGQSLIFTGNGIAAGQAPEDVIKAEGLPGALAEQVYLPVGQAVLTYQPNQVLTLQGYYQFEWEPDTFEGAGSYFNSSDFFDKGGQRLILGASPAGLEYGYRTKDNRPTHNGQFGISAQATLGNYDLGLYALRYDSKTPQVYLGLPQAGQPAGSVGTYQVVYARDIAIYGAALSTTVGPANVGGEISGRTNMPLVSGIGLLYNPVTFAPVNGNANTHPLYAVGNTLHAQVSAIYISPGIPFDPGGVSVDGEIEANHLLQVTKNKSALAPGRDDTAMTFALFVTPTYNDVLPNLEIQFPITIIYNAIGRSRIDGTMNHGTGTVSFGITGTYQTAWIAGLVYQNYIGTANPSLQGDASIADRGFLSFNIQHTF